MTTLGKDGVRILRAGEEPIELPAAKNVAAVEPTGVGDAFRAGFLGALDLGRRPTSAPRRSAACSRRTSWRPSAPRSTPSPPTSSWPALAESYGDRGGRRRGAAPARGPRASAPSRSSRQDAGAPRSAGRRPSAASSPTYSCSRIRHHAGTSTARPRVRRRRPRSCRPTGDVRAGRRPSSMTGRGQSMPAAVELEVHRPRSQAEPRRGSRDDLGQRRAGTRRPRSSVGVAGQREPHVAVRERAHRGQHVAGLQRRGGAGRAAGHAEPAPVERGDQRLAVDVEAGERDQVGEPVDRGRRRPRRPGSCATAGPDPVDQGGLPGGDLVALGDARPAARPRRRARPGTFSKPEARSSMRSSPGNGLRQRAPRRTSSTPTPAGPPHLCAEPAARGPAARAAAAGPSTRRRRRRAGRRRARAAATSATGWRVPTSWLAAWTAATATPGRRPRAATVGEVRPARGASTRDRRGPRRRRGAPPRRRRAARPSARPRSAPRRSPCRARPACSPSSPRCTASVPEEVKVTSSGRTPEALGDHRPGVVEQQPRRAGRAVQAPRIGVPLVERGDERLARGGVQRLGRRAVEVDRRPGRPRHLSQANVIDAPRTRSGGAPLRSGLA